MIDSKVKSILAKHEIFSINSERFQRDLHEMDNRIIWHFNDVLGKVGSYKSTRIIGYNEHPVYNEKEDSVAVMFENEDGETYWCHIPDTLFSEWNLKNVFKIN